MAPNSDLENETLFPFRHCESRQKREKVRGNLIEKGFGSLAMTIFYIGIWAFSLDDYAKMG
jgi:hypothetical protein